MTMHAGIVLAAGAGTRVGNSRNKVYLPLGGRRIVTWSLELFRQVPGIGRLVLVVRDSDRELVGEILEREFPDVPAVTPGTSPSTWPCSTWPTTSGGARSTSSSSTTPPAP